MENEYDDLLSYDEATVLVVDSDNQSQQKTEKPKPPQGQKKRYSAEKKPRRTTVCDRIKFTWRMLRLHILLFLMFFGSLYAGLHYGFEDSQKKVIMQALVFCDDWRQLVFFFGIYVSFAVKKVSDVTSVSQSSCVIDKLINIFINLTISAYSTDR